MPAEISTTINKIQSVPNLANKETITTFPCLSDEQGPISPPRQQLSEDIYLFC